MDSSNNPNDSTPPTPNEEPTSPQPEVTPQPEATPPAVEAPAAPEAPTPESPAVPSSEPAPEAPVSPAPNPFAAASGSAETPAPIAAAPAPKSSKKPLIIILSAVGAVIVLAIAAAIIYFGFFYISKADYQKAATTTNAIVSAAENSQNTISNISDFTSYSTTSDLDNALSKAQSSFSTYESKNSELKGLRALNDSDVKAKYNAYVSKYNVFSTYLSTLLSSYKQLAPAAIALNQVSNDQSDPNAMLNDIKTAQGAFKGAESASNKDVSTFATAEAKALGDVATNLSAYIANPSDDTAYNALLDALNQASDSENTFETNVTNNIQKNDPTDALNALITVINNKISK